MNRLIIATFNEGKYREITYELSHTGPALLSLRDLPQVPESPETGSTFLENAQQKARYYHRHFREPVLAEDSGLVVPALKGFPGIHSARIAGDDAARIGIVLDRLEGNPNRDAFYVCSMVLITASDECVVEATCEGTLTGAPVGELGFGYDPIFVPHGSSFTFGQMSLEQKSQFSHRGKAARKMIPYLLKSCSLSKG